MDLKKLYYDLTLLLGEEISLNKFLLYCDMFARETVARFPRGGVLTLGEYTPPACLSDGYSIDNEFYTACLTYLQAMAKGDEKLLALSQRLSDYAYLSLWRMRNSKKHILGVNW